MVRRSKAVEVTDNESTWPEQRTALTDYDIGRVVLASIPTAIRNNRWPASFDSNGDIRKSRLSLGPAAIMTYEGKKYTLKYKQMYALTEEHDRTPSRLHDGKYEPTKIAGGYLIDLTIDVEFTETEPSLPTELEFVKRSKNAIRDQLETEDEDTLSLMVRDNIKKVLPKPKLIHQLKAAASAPRRASVYRCLGNCQG